MTTTMVNDDLLRLQHDTGQCSPWDPCKWCDEEMDMSDVPCSAADLQAVVDVLEVVEQYKGSLNRERQR